MLVTDDENIHRQLIEVTLISELGLKKENIDFCSDGAQATEQILNDMEKKMGNENHQQYNLMILDYHLPFLNGLDVIKKCKEIYTKKGVPFPRVLILTAIED